MEEQYKLSAQGAEHEKHDEEIGSDGVYDVVPGVPVVRTNTPRPLPFNLVAAKTELPLAPSTAMTDFPVEAPDAPPLPEESARENKTPAAVQEQQTPLPVAHIDQQTQSNEFIWLFEYALEMDPTYLNRSERLNGSALPYGPAVLKGYRLIFEGLDTRTNHVIASLDAVPDQPDAEVWGILYRVPRRLAQPISPNEPSLLDKVHGSDKFVAIEVQVQETYRQREISCVTYIASLHTQRQIYQLPMENRLPEPAYLKRLLQVARRQKLPTEYLRGLEDLVPAVIPAARPLPTTPPEQITEPLPALLPGSTSHGRVTEPIMDAESLKTPTPRSAPHESMSSSRVQSWLMAFALYLSLLIIGTLILAVIQGTGQFDWIFRESFAPLGIPWYVLLYGMLGGCVSCVISLSRLEYTALPAYVLVTWFIRPLLATLLAALAYLVLTSGLIQLSLQTSQHFTVFSIAGGLAGLCEGRIFVRKSHG